MKAVLLTDVFQSGLMFAAIFAVIISGCIYAGKISTIINIYRIVFKSIIHPNVAFFEELMKNYLTLPILHNPDMSILLTIKKNRRNFPLQN